LLFDEDWKTFAQQKATNKKIFRKEYFFILQDWKTFAPFFAPKLAEKNNTQEMGIISRDIAGQNQNT
jgi:hypothetical protein